MPKIDRLVKDMLNDVKDIEAGIPSLEPERFPEAIVFIETITTCTFCGETYHSPNAHPLVRYKNKATAAKRWVPSFSILKQEKQIVRIEADKCQKCW
jgi:hypothetical protein